MLDRLCLGRVPEKPHLVFKSERGELYYEECLTRGGFDGAFSIVYHQARPHEAEPCQAKHGFRVPVAAPPAALARRHFRCFDLPNSGGAALDCRVPLLFNQHVVLGFARPTLEDPAYFVNGDADELLFVLRGSGTLRSIFGDLAFRAGDYVCVPKGTLHRFVPDSGVEQAWLSLECLGGVGLPAHYRNAVGQLKMEAPYSHRDFRRPTFVGPLDEGLRELVVKREQRFHGFRLPRTPLDVVGWDGAVYPFAFPISAFQPRVGQVHLPPPVHTTFEARGAVICSFVPRPLDFHPQANPCPYPHSSVDVDEVLFYANGAFGSRRGVGEGSLSFHPAGIAHGPHPGAYEAAPGKTHTEELAVMLDVSAPLAVTVEAAGIEDRAYHQSFRGD
ncbi:MAG TPA: homogentisate 1,2-dioxygenase [Polyangiaceae bacterium]|jgi:homogentisate 1,2-dioxygenase|nr:homogentisate 1,2-dioxygenase [Polyangiaceae bacterium]